MEQIPISSSELIECGTFIVLFHAPVYLTSEKSLPTPPAFAMKDPATKTNFYSRPQPPWLLEEYPERPGQPDCSYFIFFEAYVDEIFSWDLRTPAPPNVLNFQLMVKLSVHSTAVMGFASLDLLVSLTIQNSASSTTDGLRMARKALY
ncbi:hypothetical protein RND71_010274 [Anisodus tanguticus]|uniref:Uncharacterized protein n=1 Tax=Anisodus tanguticus TaxID=243964 RepID=A0AAE1SHG2_9SOLA|nr:hypothetical protein RND71_010274 [Anisodus tanguticus]